MSDLNDWFQNWTTEQKTEEKKEEPTQEEPKEEEPKKEEPKQEEPKAEKNSNTVKYAALYLVDEIGDMIENITSDRKDRIKEKVQELLNLIGEM